MTILLVCILSASPAFSSQSTFISDLAFGGCPYRFLRMKLDEWGNEQWRSIFEYPLENRPVLMRVNGDGSVLLVIKSCEEGTDLPGNYSLILFRQGTQDLCSPERMLAGDKQPEQGNEP